MPLAKDSPLPNPTETPSDYFTSTVHSDTYAAISPSTANLTGKTVFISGASKGIGRSIAISYAQAGASNIVIGARSSLSSVEDAIKAAATEAKRPAPKVLCLNLDVTSVESVSAAAKAVEKQFGKVDIVVNNAGIIDVPGLIADTNPDEWWNVWDINVRGVYLVTRALLPLVLKNGGGQFVNVSSVGAFLQFPTLSAYQPSKMAVIRFTEHVQSSYGDQGVVAFSVHPGGVATTIMDHVGGIPKAMEHGAFVLHHPHLPSETIEISMIRKARADIHGFDSHDRYPRACWGLNCLPHQGET